MWLDFCAGLGLERDRVDGGDIQPKTQAWLDTYSSTCAQESFQEGLAAIYAYEKQVPQVALEKMRGLKAFHGVTDEPSLRFFETQVVQDQVHSQRVAEGIYQHTRPEDEPAVEAAVQLALDAWWGFLDGVEDSRHSKMVASR